jgi:hypothetical protein
MILDWFSGPITFKTQRAEIAAKIPLGANYETDAPLTLIQIVESATNSEWPAKAG